MSLKYRNNAGVETPVAGLNGTSGELVPSASYVQSGTINVTGMGTSSDKTSQDFAVTFQTPMPDADYEVFLTGDNYFNYYVTNAKTANGFSVRVCNYSFTNGTSTGIVKWTAFKLITNEDRALDEQAIVNLQAVVPNDASSSNKLVTANSLAPEVTDLTPYLSSGWTVREYLRGYKVGNMVIIDFGGVKRNSDTAAGRNVYLMQGLPYSIKNRAVSFLFSDEAANAKKATVYVVDSLGVIVSDIRITYPSLSASDDNLYGQMILALN